MSGSEGSFLSRWSRLKRSRRDEPRAADDGVPTDSAAPNVPAAAVVSAETAASQAAAGARAVPESTQRADDGHPVASDSAAFPALPPIDSLTPGSDFKPFMQAGIDAATRNAALKRLFADPQFNVMDGLDVYIDDYGKTEPIPSQMLGRLLDEHATSLADRLLGEAPPGNGIEAVAAESGRHAHEPAQHPTGEPASTKAERDSAMATRAVDDESSAANGGQPDDPAGDADPCSGLHRR
ncbi:MAG TPA: DUF3306 domain-containing protein [Zeimonas sp.]|nr:DUF3306 domain-containing protein [Zeimonas sp.]